MNAAKTEKVVGLMKERLRFRTQCRSIADEMTRIIMKEMLIIPPECVHSVLKMMESEMQQAARMSNPGGDES